MLMHDRHHLPADHDLRSIRARVAARGPPWDAAPGLGFKAFLLEDRAANAPENACASLDLWLDPRAAPDFLADAPFSAVIEGFGRPEIETWMPLDVQAGAAFGASALERGERPVPVGTDLGALVRSEAERSRVLAAEPDVCATVSGLDPKAWRVVRFTLRAEVLRDVRAPRGTTNASMTGRSARCRISHGPACPQPMPRSPPDDPRHEDPAMPLTRISLRAGKSPAFHAALAAGLYAALRETFAVPENDQFTVIHEHAASAFVYDPNYLGIARDDDLVMIQITANDTRDTAQKRALYAAIARNLGQDPGVKPGNVLVTLVEVSRENWSFGDGLMAYGPPA